MANKTHLVSDYEDGGQACRTVCGMWGFRSDRLSNEFTTATCNIFEAEIDHRHVDCKRCRRALQAHASTAQED